MKWFYLWQLKKANDRMRDALRAMPPGPCPEIDDPTFEAWAHGAVEFFLANSDVEYYKKKLGIE